MEEVIYYNELYDLYSDLLTTKQKEYFEEYYFNNLSLGEMAENYNVSRNAIHKQLRNVVKKLEEYENILKLHSKNKKIAQLIITTKDNKLKKKLEELL